jgi:RNA-binding protein
MALVSQGAPRAALRPGFSATGHQRSMVHMNRTLDKQDLRALRGRCHALQPVVMIADDGLTDNIAQAIETALDDHELIKVRIRTDREARADIAARILERTGAAQVMAIGQVLCLYRARPATPRPH